MAKLPAMRNDVRRPKVLQTVFGGLRHTVNCADGEFYDMMNLSCKDYPVLCGRDRRRMGWKLSGAKQIYADNGVLLYIKEDGGIWYAKKNTAPVGGEYGFAIAYTKSAEKAQLVRFGDRVILMPDKKLINLKYELLGVISNVSELPESGSYEDAYALSTGHGEGNVDTYDVYVFNENEWINNGTLVQDMDAKLSVTEITIMDGVIYEEPAKANTIAFPGLSVDLRTLFKEGDAVTISGLTKEPRNNKTAIIREMNDHLMRFSEYAFYIPKSEAGQTQTEYEETGTIHVERIVPEMNFIFEHENRLWGAQGKQIFASKLGDPRNFNVFDGLSTDSWYLQTQSRGDILGGCSYGGYPVFFRDSAICTIYGQSAQGFQTYERQAPGLKHGAQRSIAEAGGALFYLSQNGMNVYTGDYPKDLQQIFGNDAVHQAVSISNGSYLYVHMDGKLYVFDALRGLWMIEDAGEFISFAQMNGTIFALDANGQLYELRGDEMQWQEEQDAPSCFAEFGDFVDEPNMKSIVKLQMRIEPEKGTTITVKIKYQGKKDWQTVQSVTGDGEKRSYYIAVIPHRTDNYRLRIETSGGKWRLYSLVREKIAGSEIR